MKTTIELPDALFRRAKAAAATRGVSLKQFFTESVERRLAGAEKDPAQPAWKKFHGALAGLRSETRRIDRAVAAEFERIDDEEAG